VSRCFSSAPRLRDGFRPKEPRRFAAVDGRLRAAEPCPPRVPAEFVPATKTLDNPALFQCPFAAHRCPKAEWTVEQEVVMNWAALPLRAGRDIAKCKRLALMRVEGLRVPWSHWRHWRARARPRAWDNACTLNDASFSNELNGASRRGCVPRFSTAGQGSNAKFLVNGAAGPKHAKCESSLSHEIRRLGYA
jgi:hypothetical protein